MVLYDNGEVVVEVEETARIMVMGSKPIYLTLPELAGIGKVIAAYFAEGHMDECKRTKWVQNHADMPF